MTRAPRKPCHSMALRYLPRTCRQHSSPHSMACLHKCSLWKKYAPTSDPAFKRDAHPVDTKTLIIVASIAVGLVLLKALLGRKPMPPIKTFICARCSTVEEYGPRSIEASSKGIDEVILPKLSPRVAR